MANQTITQLPDAGPITGTELVPIVQNGGTYKTTAAALAGSPVQTQTFLTLNQEPTLNNSRYLTSGAGIGLVDGGPQSFYRITLNGVSGTLETMGNGFAVNVGGTMTARSITYSGFGITVSNGDGQSGNPTIALDGTVASLANNGGTGFVALPGNGTVAGRTLTGTADQIDITNPNGVAGSPVFSISDNPVLPGTGGVVVPGGTTAERPGSPSNGLIRYNTQSQTLEGYAGNTWGSIAVGSGVTSVGLVMPSQFTVTGSPVTSSGDLTASWASQTANYFLAAPNGTSGTPTFRAIVAADVPTLNQNTTGTAAAIAGGDANKVLYQSAAGVTTFIDAPTTGSTFLEWSGSGFQWSSIIGGLSYQGGWNASTNTPTLTSSVGTNGYYYVVTTAGSTNLDGITDWQIGDWAIFNGSTWQKIDQTNTVSSVNGYTGAVVLSYSDVGAPSTTGTNATGTWGIDISGNAATATSATSATTATNVAGGAANKIVYNTASGTTSFIDAPVTAGHYLKWTGSAFEWNVAGTGTVTSVDVSGGTTGLTTSGGPVTSSGTITLAGTLIPANGGTGISSYAVGDLLFANTTTTLDKLTVGASGYLLASNGTAPAYADPAGITVGNAANATNATDATNAANVATTATSTNADFFIPFVAASTTGNQALGVDAGLSYNPSTNAMTSAINGGTF